MWGGPDAEIGGGRGRSARREGWENDKGGKGEKRMEGKVEMKEEG